MRKFLIRFLIYGLLGPAATYAGIYLTVRHVEWWWWPQPSIYWVELTPFLLGALVDGTLKHLSVFERSVITGSTVFVASGMACTLAYGGFGAWVLGICTPVITAACSVLAAGTDIEDGDFIEE
ncbi:hypothetical protein [Bradyrhizobium sp. SZCCHNRI1003]|uniref:hypothetical protein n=1 Tax=Bradyrhizobium sp. SZCCHNRI1003 TaxID=3057275 RepID=UPI002915F56F|nr:hypothetical protein [Bradyrhizobium sp. SZCCHNRI1003]